jgi:hypothetical protein
LPTPLVTAPSDRRTEPMSFHVTPRERDRIRALADAENRTVSTYCRLVVLGHLPQPTPTDEAR